jgi:hypothetical protein
VDVRLEKVAVSMVVKPASNGKFTPARWVLAHFKQVVDREFATRKAEIVQTINTGKSGDQLALHWQAIRNTRDHLAHVGIQDNTAWMEVCYKNQEEAKKHLNEHKLNGTDGDQGVNTFVMLYDLRGGRLFRLGHKAAQFCDIEPDVTLQA